MKPRVMVLGGGTPTATATTEILDLSQTNPAWVPGGDMPSGARVQMNAVILPNGKVLAVGGSGTNEDPTTATLGADLYDPASGAWSSAGTTSYPRLYHSVALLLADGMVALAGSNPVRGTYEEHTENNGGAPSVASFVQVINNPTDRPPTAKITAPAGDLIIKAGQTVKFKGSAGDSDGSVSAYSWYFPSGTPNTSTVLNPGKVKFPTAGTSVVSLTLLDNLGINNPSPPTRTIHVQPAVRITNPAAGTNVKGNVTIKAKVIGAIGDTNIFTFMVDNAVLSTETTSATSASCNWNTQNQGPGPLTLTVSVTCSDVIDPASKTGSVSEQVNVE